MKYFMTKLSAIKGVIHELEDELKAVDDLDQATINRIDNNVVKFIKKNL